VPTPTNIDDTERGLLPVFDPSGRRVVGGLDPVPVRNGNGPRRSSLPVTPLPAARPASPARPASRRRAAAPQSRTDRARNAAGRALNAVGRGINAGVNAGRRLRARRRRRRRR